MSDYDLTATDGRMLAPEPCSNCGSSGHLSSSCPRPPLITAPERFSGPLAPSGRVRGGYPVRPEADHTSPENAPGGEEHEMPETGWPDRDEADTQVVEPEELKEQTWRLFRREPSGYWDELDPLYGAGKYGYNPQPEDIGERHGPGVYMLIEHSARQDSDYGSLTWVRTVEVVADTVYRFSRDQAVELHTVGES